MLALAAVGVLPMATQAQAADAEQTASPEVRELRITGVRSVDESELRDSLATQASACRSLLLRPFCLVSRSRFVYERRFLDRDELERDVLRVLVYYFRRGYRDAAAEQTVTALGGNEVRVTITVTENAPTRVAERTVPDSGPLTARELRQFSAPREGEPLDLVALDSSVNLLRNALWDRGYANADVAPVVTVDDSRDAADVVLNVNPGALIRIGSITIVGNEQVEEETIRKSLLISPGDLFRRTAIGESQRALYESNLFRRAMIDTAITNNAAARDSVKRLIVLVQEADMREARVRAGFTTADFALVDARFTHNYWLGGPRRLDVNAAVGNLFARQLSESPLFADISNIVADNALGRFYVPTYSASVDVRQRWFRSPHNTVSAGVFTHRRSSPGVFVDRGIGANASVTRRLAERTSLSAIYRYEVSRVEAGDVYFCVNFGVCDDFTISALRGRQRLSPLATTVTRTTTDQPFSPTRGMRGRAEFEHASAYTVSDFRYNRAYAEAAFYRTIPFRNAVLAVNVRAGWVDPIASTTAATGVGAPGDEPGLASSQILHPRKRFYSGGSQSVRGFGENQLGPRVLTIDPDLLRGRRDSAGTTLYACEPSIPIRECDLTREGLSDADFRPRPLGGTTLLEGGIELRIPVWGPVVGALFVDGAILGEGTLNSISQGTGALTPGVGVRYESPVGPIRVDLGWRPLLRQALPVITQVTDSLGNRQLVNLAPAEGCRSLTTPGCRVFPDAGSETGFFDRITRRLTLHLSIGQAF
jgi:outer membrane protein insertion porin family/translocation and assembly module TamA